MPTPHSECADVLSTLTWPWTVGPSRAQGAAWRFSLGVFAGAAWALMLCLTPIKGNPILNPMPQDTWEENGRFYARDSDMGVTAEASTANEALAKLNSLTAPAPSSVEAEPAPPKLTPPATIYRILTEDGTEYGPVPFDTVKTWIAEGRVQPSHKVRVHGGGLAPASDLPELRPLFGLPPLPPRSTGQSTTQILGIVGIVLGVLIAGAGFATANSLEYQARSAFGEKNQEPQIAIIFGVIVAIVGLILALTKKPED